MEVGGGKGSCIDNEISWWKICGCWKLWLVVLIGGIKGNTYKGVEKGDEVWRTNNKKNEGNMAEIGNVDEDDGVDEYESDNYING